MKAIRITTDNLIQVEDAGKRVHEHLSGQGTDCIAYVKPRYAAPGTVLVVDDNGLLRDLPVNEAASLMYGTQYHGHPIVGDVLVMKISAEPDYVMFDDDEAQTVIHNLMRRFPYLKTEDKE